MAMGTAIITVMGMGMAKTLKKNRGISALFKWLLIATPINLEMAVSVIFQKSLH